MRWLMLLVGVVCAQACGTVAVRFPADPVDGGARDAGVDGGADGGSGCQRTGCPSGLQCDPVSTRCVECLGPQHCGGATPACEPSLHRCVPCLAGQGCGGTSTCSAEWVCVPSCNDSSECPGYADGCVDHVCAQCTDDESCADAGLLCRTDTGQCVGCVSDQDCQGATPHCQPWTGTCAQCVSSSDCPAGQGCAAGTCR